MQTLVFVAEEACSRLDVFVSNNVEDLTRSAVKKLIESGAVLRNEKTARASQDIKVGDVITVNLPEPEISEAVPEDIPIDIVYEDDDMAVINKAQGMTVHAGNGNTQGTLVNALLFHLKSLSGIGGVIRPGIVHRIDKDTSGLLVVAKNDKAHLSLSKQIAEKSCHRTYLALLEGNLKQDRGTVTTYLGRDPNNRIKMAVVPPDKGRIAITDYEVVQRYQGYTLCRFMLHTGRTHQIRVHSVYLGHPIVGDLVYGIKKQKFALNGQLLHACKLELTQPTTGERMTFEAPLPEYFTDVLKKLNKI